MSETPEQLKDRKEKVISKIGELKRELQQKNDELEEINDNLGIIPKKRNMKRKREELGEEQITDGILSPQEKRSKVIVKELFEKVKEDISGIVTKMNNENDEGEEVNSLEKVLRGIWKRKCMKD